MTHRRRHPNHIFVALSLIVNVAVFSYRSQKMSIYGKKITEPLDCALCANLFAQQTQFLANGCSVFSWPPSLILMAEEGWGEKEICTKGVIDGQKLGEGLTLTPNQTWLVG